MRLAHRPACAGVHGSTACGRPAAPGTRASRRSWRVICLVAVGARRRAAGLTPDATRLPPGGRAVPLMAVLVGWSFVGAGRSHAWLRRPDNATGRAHGGVRHRRRWSACSRSPTRRCRTCSRRSPTRCRSRSSSTCCWLPVRAAGETAARAVVVARAMRPRASRRWWRCCSAIRPGDQNCADCPSNPLLVADARRLADAAGDVKRVLGAALALAALALVVRRARRARARSSAAATRRWPLPRPRSCSGLSRVGPRRRRAERRRRRRRRSWCSSPPSPRCRPRSSLGLARTRFFRGATVERPDRPARASEAAPRRGRARRRPSATPRSSSPTGCPSAATTSIATAARAAAGGPRRAMRPRSPTRAAASAPSSTTGR